MPEALRVTALLSAYNAAAFIQPVLEGLSAQTWSPYEVLVSVDASDDATADLCSAHARRDARFRVWRQARRLGWIGNSNFLLEQAQATPADCAFFAFHDDPHIPGYVEALARGLAARPDAVLAYADMEQTEVDGSRSRVAYKAPDAADAVARGLRVLQREGSWWVPNRGLFRMTAARQSGGLKPHGGGEFAADWAWLLSLALQGPFVHVADTVSIKHYKPSSLSLSWDYGTRSWIEAAASCMREVWNSALPTPEKLALAAKLGQAMHRAYAELPKPPVRQ